MPGSVRAAQRPSVVTPAGSEGLTSPFPCPYRMCVLGLAGRSFTRCENASIFFFSFLRIRVFFSLKFYKIYIEALYE